MKKANDHKGSRGFTLLEVVAAIAILAVLLVPILGAVSGGLKNVGKIEKRSVALRLAQDKMSAIEMTKIPDSEGTDSGEFGDDYPDYRWEVEAVKTPEIQLIEQALPQMNGMEIHLRVYWGEKDNEDYIEISTLLLGNDYDSGH